MTPGLEERLMNGTEDDIVQMAELVSTPPSLFYTMSSLVKIQKGVSGARADDTKSLKAVIIDWITPCGEPLTPPLSRNVKAGRGYNHERTGALLCPAGLDWGDPQ
jgi:hypothetical protein